MPHDCEATVHRHTDTWTGIQGRPRFYKSGPCSRRGKVPLVNRQGVTRWFCTQHAGLALEGFVSPNGETQGPRDMAAYHRYPDMTPPHRGEWSHPKEA